MADSATRWLTIPDTDGELLDTLTRLEEVLLQLQPYDDNDEPAAEGLGADELHAVQHISMGIHAAERSDTPELYAPDGTFNYVPLRVCQVRGSGSNGAGSSAIAFSLLNTPALPIRVSSLHERPCCGNFGPDRRAACSPVAGFRLTARPDRTTRITMTAVHRELPKSTNRRRQQ